MGMGNNKWETADLKKGKGRKCYGKMEGGRWISGGKKLNKIG